MRCVGSTLPDPSFFSPHSLFSRHCDAFVTNLTAAEFHALYRTPALPTASSGGATPIYRVTCELRFTGAASESATNLLRDKELWLFSERVRGNTRLFMRLYINEDKMVGVLEYGSLPYY
ncbi:hypothetical protein EVAR_98370_1 [Eumeta japonica]|uniref:Uncharacterized protein n=1 Tax=Eumeta variegata TaxID=151549 RepID=A0A4C2A314_EUMVA|nr:hypothetical protein EVAR_98370_1 [Eumeta japonica]